MDQRNVLSPLENQFIMNKGLLSQALLFCLCVTQATSAEKIESVPTVYRSF